MFPDVLHGHIWHTTSPERYESILRTGAILVAPPLSDAERWRANRGPDHYPFVRSIEGISLFDFRDFDPKTYSERNSATWWTFVPCREDWAHAIWIQLNPLLLSEHFLDGAAVLRRWKEAKTGRTLMPEIEAAHVGDIHCDHFSSVMCLSKPPRPVY